MLILTIRTDNPIAEVGLYDNKNQLDYFTWPAHRQLAETIHLKIRDLLTQNNQTLENLQAIVIFRGPGSFTGLRIGLSVANALAGSLQIPIVGLNGNSWVEQGVKQLQKGEASRQVMPEYGAPPRITKPKK